MAADWLSARTRLGGATRFEGYEHTEITAKVLMILKDGDEASSVGQGSTVQVVFERTPFYAESGGQASDNRGEVEWPNGRATLIGVTREAADLFVHTLIIDE